jgi:cobalt-zinc-cadmium resistance protein CzcA
MNRLILVPILFFFYSTHAQTLSQQEAISIALKNNGWVAAASSEVKSFDQLKKSETDIGKFSATATFGEINSRAQDNNFKVSQTIPFPTLLAAKARLGQANLEGAEKKLTVVQHQLIYDVKVSYEKLRFLIATNKLLTTEDSLYSELARIMEINYRAGEATYLEKLTAETNSLSSKNTLQQQQSEIDIEQKHLQTLLQTNDPVLPEADLTPLLWQGATTSISNAELSYQQQQTAIALQQKRVQQNAFLPDITVGYFNQSFVGYQNIVGVEEYYDRGSRFQGFEVGLSLPLWIKPQLARAKAARHQIEAATQKTSYLQQEVEQKIAQVNRERLKNEANIDYFETTALKQADLIISQSKKSLAAGEINYLIYLQSLKSALALRTNYITALHQYNLSIVNLEFLTGSL